MPDAQWGGSRAAWRRRHTVGFRFPKAIIQHAIWLYLRFTLSLRDVEELLAERGIMVTYETVRVWVARFGPLIARRLRRRRGRPSNVWHLDEMFVRIGRSADVPVAGHFCAANPTTPSGSIPTVSAD